jgi:CBS domain containing-hemolysin-like protein
MSDYILLPILLVFSSFFSASETALFSLSREALALYASSKSPLKRLVALLLKDSRTLLITILLGNLIANVTFYAVASNHALTLIEEGQRAAGTAFAIAAPIVLIIFGEVTPKNVALGFVEVIAQLAAPVLLVIQVVTWPLRVVLTRMAAVVGDVLTAGMPRSVYVNPDELKMLIRTSEKQGVIGPHEGLMMQGLVDFGRMLVRDVMVPRVDMVMYDRSRPRSELIDIIRRTGHSRVPVYEGTKEHILGVVMSREVLLAPPERPLQGMLRPVHFVPETKTVESLLNEFRRQNRVFAVVVDEYGGTAGLVTLKDVVEAIVGEIREEREEAEPMVREVGENRWLLSGRLSVVDWAKMFNLAVGDRRLATLGGLVTLLLRKLPAEGEQVRYGNILFTVTRMKGPSVEEVLVEYSPEKPGRKERGR